MSKDQKTYRVLAKVTLSDGTSLEGDIHLQTGSERGMVTLNESLLDLVNKELIEPKEAYMKSSDKEPLASALVAQGYELPFLA